jgi:hypothetical protein
MQIWDARVKVEKNHASNSIRSLSTVSSWYISSCLRPISYFESSLSGNVEEIECSTQRTKACLTPIYVQNAVARLNYVKIALE